MDEFIFRARPWAITLVLHNWPIIACALAGLLAALRAYQQPSRPALLRLYGIGTLALAYEYHKHGVSVAHETLSYLFSAERNPTVRELSLLVLLQIVPVELYVAGFVLLANAFLTGRPGPRRRRRVPRTGRVGMGRDEKPAGS